METTPSLQKNVSSGTTVDASPLTSAPQLTMLELNAIRLDMNHTVLTPDYLERVKAKNAASQNQK